MYFFKNLFIFIFRDFKHYDLAIVASFGEFIPEKVINLFPKYATYYV